MPTNRELLKENRELRSQVTDLQDRLDQAVDVLAPSADDEEDDLEEGGEDDYYEDDPDED